MLFIRINDNQTINAEIIALVTKEGGSLELLTKNGKTYKIIDLLYVREAKKQLGL